MEVVAVAVVAFEDRENAAATLLLDDSTFETFLLPSDDDDEATVSFEDFDPAAIARVADRDATNNSSDTTCARSSTAGPVVVPLA